MPGRSLLRRVVGGVALGAVVAGVVGVVPVGADEIDDARAAAAALGAELDGLSEQIAVVAEEHNGARIALEGVQARIVEAEGRVGETEALLDEGREQLRVWAVDAYVRSGTASDAVLATTGAGSPGEGLGRGAYLRWLSGDREDIDDRLEARADDLEAELESLAEAEAEAAALAAELDGRRAEVEAVEAEQQALLDAADAEVARLLDEQTRREEAAQAAAAASALAAVQVAQDEGPALPGPASATPTPPQPAPAPPVGGDAAPRPGPAAPPPPPSSGGAAGVVAEAMRHLGKPYVWGAGGPGSFDCSGFTSYVWRVGGGVSLPHQSRSQRASTTQISRDQLRPGDLVFYGSPIHHVALYIGDGRIVHAPNSRSVVRVDSIDYWSAVSGYGRVN